MGKLGSSGENSVNFPLRRMVVASPSVQLFAPREQAVRTPTVEASYSSMTLKVIRSSRVLGQDAV